MSYPVAKSALAEYTCITKLANYYVPTYEPIRKLNI